MKFSYEGIGQWAATFACKNVEVGSLVKISANGTASACASGDNFCGSVLSVSRSGDACAVVLGGMVCADYSDTAPALGWSGLVSDGAGGVKASVDGRSHLVVDVDDSAKIVTFVL